jgi:hypothetical protein
MGASNSDVPPGLNSETRRPVLGTERLVLMDPLGLVVF